MIKKTLSEIAAYIGGEVDEAYADIVVEGVDFDTRKIAAGNLFIPLKGNLTDGHQHVEEALSKGAAASFWERSIPNPPKQIPLIFVEDSLEALQTLAKAYLRTLSATIIGITGSNGKTTTKDLIAEVLGQTFIVHKTNGNYNNHIGLPLTILATPQNCEVLILEMGMNHRGEISFLSKLAQPHIAVITNIGDSHLEALGSREGIADAKCEIVDGLQNDGVLFYNGDEPLLIERLSALENKQSFGREETNDFYPEKIEEHEDGTAFEVAGQDFFLPILGLHNVMNALAAIAVAREFNMSRTEIATGLREVQLTHMRMEVVIGANGEKLCNDAYNASPTSVKAALEMVHNRKGCNRKMVVLGDMLELGENEITYHREIGELIDPDEVTYVLAYGELSSHIAEGAKQHFSEDRVFHFLDKNELINKLAGLTETNDFVLVKASRGMQLEEVIQQLKGTDN